MGELHLEIIKNRILKEFKVDAYMGPLQVAYRETINQDATASNSIASKIGVLLLYVWFVIILEYLLLLHYYISEFNMLSQLKWQISFIFYKNWVC